ncbi:MAG: ATP-dependent helicase, partial [Clostridia bacterium]|nr:ATP-dependent helicase [Clostridia bacterium]
MTVPELLNNLTNDPGFMANVECMRTLPANPACYAPFPETLDQRIIEVLRQRGITQLYSHQARALGLAFQGKDLVVVTPTASGKTL